MGGLGAARRDLRAPPGPPAADVVEGGQIAVATWKGSVWVVVDRRDQPDVLVSGAIREAIEHRVEAAAHLVDAPSGPRERATAGRGSPRW